MKQIIEIGVQTRKVEPARCKTDLLVVGRFSDGEPDEVVRVLDRWLGGRIDRLAKLGDFKGKAKTHALVYGEGKIGAERVLLVGLGERKKATLDTLRRAAALAAGRAVDLKLPGVALALHHAFGADPEAAAQGRAMAEGAYLGSYRYDEFVTASENGRRGALDVQIVDPDAARIRSLAPGVAAGVIIGRAQAEARTLANRPANVIDPPALARTAREMLRGLPTVRCTVFDEKKLRTSRMGGILAVGSGSRSKPRLILLKYTPRRRPARGLPTVALVGKAVTFDSGGISIKPAQDMDQMKFDKTGGIAVLAAIKALAELELPIDVLGLIPAAENLPSGSSYRPGDIVTTYSGKTVEILNTDAEGRMILCDALAYAARQKREVIIDIATLTGACMVALGAYKAGLMSNDDELAAQLQTAADASGESVWRLPTGDEYAEEMKSKIADLKNCGSRWGGACTAASFLQQFVGTAKWAHLDIAGMDVLLKPTEYGCVGGTGFGVRLLTTYLMNLVDRKSSDV
ncbi:MAG: leucyl aminopeptidase [Planctomycetes bacterium]|jgi:leucyl aminopeptidase|nr:leucyl aminopeptidase [Planctomycetota bacterium]